MSVYNTEDYLKQAIESVVEQTYTNFELIIVNDGSTDNSGEIVDSYAERDNRIVVIHKENSGLSDSRNIALKKVTGDYVGFIDSDDWYEPDALRTVEKAFAADDGVGMVSIAVRFISPETGETKRLFRSMPGWQLPFRMTVPHPGLFVSRRVYDAIGLYDTKYRISADYDFIWRCRKKGIRMARLDDALVNMELGGTANQNRPLARKETLDIACRYCRFPVLPWLAWLGRTMTGR